MSAPAAARTRACFVAVMGEPNAGKSLLVNRLVGAKVSAVSNKYNTTRRRVLGIRTVGDTQLVYHDTPGLLDPRAQTSLRYVKPLVTAAAEAVPNSDLVAFVVDVSAKHRPSADLSMGRALEMAAESSAKPVLVLNKIDAFNKKQRPLLERACSTTVDTFEQLAFATGAMPAAGFDDPEAIQPFHVSALHRVGVRALHNCFVAHATEQPWLFPPTALTDLTPQQRAVEAVREKLYRMLHHEVPYRAQLRIRGWSLDKSTNLLWIDMDVGVATRGQVRMVVGRKAATVNAIATAAARDLETALGCKVHLVLHARVAKSQKHSEDTL